MSLETDHNTKETYQIGLDMIYQENITEYINIIMDFKQNLRKSYTVFWEFCNKQLQNSIETNVDNEMKIQDNPIEIFKSINILVHKPERSEYPFVSVTEAFKHVVNLKQKYNENLLD